METQTRLEEATEAKNRGDFSQAEQIYNEILSKSAGSNESALREQESALIQLGQLYRDQKYVLSQHSRLTMFQTSRQTRRPHQNIQNHHVKLRQSQNCQNWYLGLLRNGPS